MQKAGIEIIPEFKIKYPEYSVITPITKKEYTIRSLKVGEEENLKGSLLTKNIITQHLNETIFSCLVKKPNDIKTFEDFLQKNTIKDRDALFFGLYHATYKDIHNYDVTCKECNHESSVKINFVNSFSMKCWDKVKENTDDKDNKKTVEIDPLSYDIEVPLEICENLKVVLGLVTLQQEMEVMKSLSFVSDQERSTYHDELKINYVEINIDGQKTPDKISDRKNIHSIYTNLPSTDRKMIEKKYTSELESYGMTLKSIIYCQKCKAENKIDIDLVRQFFRALYE